MECGFKLFILFFKGTVGVNAPFFLSSLLGIGEGIYSANEFPDKR